MNINPTGNIFSELGGIFCIPQQDFASQLKNIKAFVFDWDGVFNNGTKNEQGSSSFNEIDAMGTNMLRFSYFLEKNELPLAAIMSGERNTQSFQFGAREHFHSIYYKVKNKRQALHHFLDCHKLVAHEVAFFFDDVLDLSVAELCGIRILIDRKANPLFKNYTIRNGIADYVTAHQGGNFALREACEMLIGLCGNYDLTIENRSHFSDKYSLYLTQRQDIKTAFYTRINNQIESALPEETNLPT